MAVVPERLQKIYDGCFQIEQTISDAYFSDKLLQYLPEKEQKTEIPNASSHVQNSGMGPGNRSENSLSCSNNSLKNEFFDAVFKAYRMVFEMEEELQSLVEETCFSSKQRMLIYKMLSSGIETRLVEPGFFQIRMPFNLAHRSAVIPETHVKNAMQNAMKVYRMEHPDYYRNIISGSHVIVFESVFSEKNRVIDPDNYHMMEVKYCIDPLCGTLITRDDGLYCRLHFMARMGEQPQTILSVVDLKSSRLADVLHG